MKSASAEYKQLMKEPMRPRGFMMVSVGVINLEAQADSKMRGNFTWYSNPNRVFTDSHDAISYATLEQNYFKADGSMFFLPENGGSARQQNLITRDILGSTTIRFGTEYDLKGITINFGEYYPTRFQIVFNGTVRTYDNASPVFHTLDVFIGVQEMTIIPVTMIGGQQRMRINEITFGVGLTFQNDVISKANLVEFCHAVSEELPYIEYNVDVLDKENQFNVDEVSSTVNFLEIGQEINVKVGLDVNGNTEWFDMATLFLSDWKSTRGIMTFKARDRFYFMDKRYNGSNRIYTRTLYQEAITVLTAAGLEPDEYLVDESLMDITITNPLLNYSYAECLQFIANAGRCLLFQDQYGRIVLRANFANVIEPTDISVSATEEAPYSDVQSVTTGASTIYADLTQDFFSADGSFFFLPESGSYLPDTGFVTSEVADENGEFETNPTLTLKLQAGFIYYGVYVRFGGNAPQEVVLHTFYNGNAVEDVIFNQIQSGDNIFNHEFRTFDKLTIEVTKAAANNRTIIQKVSFGDLSDYKLRIADMYEYPIGIKEVKAKTVSVKIFTFENVDNKPVLVDDDVWVEQDVFTAGINVTYENPLISTQEHARMVAKWLGNYHKNNISYNVNYRGEPRLNAGDIIFMESEVLNSLQTEIGKNTFTFNGAFGGNLELRRALKMMEDD